MSTNNQDYTAMLQSKANETVWLPAQIKNGMIENATQAYVETKGARKGETNYKTRKKPTEYGRYEAPEVGTFVANKHTEKTILKTKEIDIDARMLRYGRNVKVRHARMGWDDIFARAAHRAIEIIESSQLSNSNQAGANTDGAVNGRITQN